jgi:putative nucleotidyltransferase with HDIG domain
MASGTKLKLTPISVETLEENHSYNYPLYQKIITNEKTEDIFQKVVETNHSYNQQLKNKIESQNLKHLFIHTTDLETHHKDVNSYVKKVLSDKNVESHKKCEILHTHTAQCVQELLTENVTGEKINQVKEIIAETLPLMLENSGETNKVMIQVLSHDYYTYTHSVGVSTYAMGFANYLKLKEEDLNKIGIGGLLHDLGKKNVPLDIINKPGKLTDKEFKIMQNHPQWGVDLLQEVGETDEGILSILLQHHEKQHGGGYPNNLNGNQIHLYAQITTISDIFNALTTKRSYKNPFTTMEALTMMKEKMLHDLNPKLFFEFVKYMAKD